MEDLYMTTILAQHTNASKSVYIYCTVQPEIINLERKYLPFIQHIGRYELTNYTITPKMYADNYPDIKVHLLKKDDIIITPGGTKSCVTIIKEDIKNLVTPGVYIVVRCKIDILPKYLFYYLLHTDKLHEIKNKYNAIELLLNAVSFRYARIIIPPKNIQQEIIDHYDKSVTDE
jgi:restriction endonuclease S subunit